MRRPAALLVLVIALTACRGETTGIPSPTAPGSVSPSPTPSRLPRKPPRATLAVYSSGTAIVLYDVEQDSARAVARGDTVSQPQFLTKDTVTFVSESGGSGTLFRLDLQTGATEELFSVDTGIDTYAVHPDGSEVAFVTRGEDSFPRLRIVTLVEGRPVQSVATLARALGRGISADDMLRIDYARGGERFFVVYTYADGEGERVPDDQSQFQVRSRDGDLEFAPNHGADPTMGTWSPDGERLYYRIRSGVRRWEPAGGVSSIGLPTWFNPWISTNGRLIAFDTGQTQRGARVRVLDLSTGGVETVGDSNLFHPVFATNSVVWAQRLEPCTGEGCLDPVFPSDEVVSINIRTGATKGLAITKLVGVDVWYERPRPRGT